MDSDSIAKELANSYSDYLKVDMTKEIALTEEIADDTLTRLEELENSIVMMQGNDSSEIIRCLREQKVKLMQLCEKVHKLETFVGTVAQDVNIMEAKVIEAECDIKDNSEGKLKSMLKPLMFMKPDHVTPKQQIIRQPRFEPPITFQTRSFFPPSAEEEEEENME